MSEPAGRKRRWPRRLLYGVLGLVAAAGLVRFTARLSGGPIAFVPGGRLSGPLAADQDPDWGFTRDVETIQVEVRPDDPLSVTTWVFTHDGELYVAADFFNPWKRWPHLALQDPDVRLRIAGRIYERRAVRVTDPRLVEDLRRAIGEKYDVAPDGLAAKVDVWFFRMDPRPPRSE